MSSPRGPVRDLRRGVAGSRRPPVHSSQANSSIPGVLKNAIDWASRPPAPRRRCPGQAGRRVGGHDRPVRGGLGPGELRKVLASTTALASSTSSCRSRRPTDCSTARQADRPRPHARHTGKDRFAPLTTRSTQPGSRSQPRTRGAPRATERLDAEGRRAENARFATVAKPSSSSRTASSRWATRSAAGNPHVRRRPVRTSEGPPPPSLPCGRARAATARRSAGVRGGRSAGASLGNARNSPVLMPDEEVRQQLERDALLDPGTSNAPLAADRDNRPPPRRAAGWAPPRRGRSGAALPGTSTARSSSTAPGSTARPAAVHAVQRRASRRGSARMRPRAARRTTPPRATIRG